MNGWELLAVFVSVALFIVGITAVSNVFIFPCLRPACPAETPFVSILVPARNEATVIARTVARLLAQSYRNFELIVLDDHSQDGTASLAHRAAAHDPRFRLVQGQPLPDGWLGKNWACHQLAQAARGDVLLFTDADVQWEPEGVAAVIDMLQRPYATPGARSRPTPDLLTIWPTQQTETWAERLVVPNMALAILAYLPVLPVHYTAWPIFAAANGQCMVFRRAAYAAVGGHAAVRGQIVEDVALAQRVKAQGLRLRMADGSGLVGCRMYAGWPQVRDGFAKNILAGHGNSIPFLFISTIFHWLVFVWPWVWLLLSLLTPLPGTLWALLLLIVGVSVRGGTAVFTRQRLQDALLMPVSVILMTRIAAQSVWWRFQGGPRWKGRVVAQKQ